MIYLTYNDQPTGVYFSQVTDVCNFINKEFNCQIRLVALISLRSFLSNRKKIKQYCPEAIVLPMYPKNKNWRKNIGILSTLFLFIGNQNIWSRGLFATNIALELKKKKKTEKVVFDARGAYKAEFEEYLNNVVTIKDDIFTLEKNAIYFTDYRLAISKSLVSYWVSNYNYNEKKYCVIPCTLSQSNFSRAIEAETEISKIRNELSISDNEIVFVYSGSSADWQSLSLIDDLMTRTFQDISNIKLIILSNANIKDLNIYKNFSEKIIQLWVKPEEVFKYLSAGDYGLIIRERSITNNVASPTKFAEYLNAGLEVLISESIGDFSTFVRSKKCGEVIDDVNKNLIFESVSYGEKKKNNKLARDNFSKLNFKREYNKIVHELS